VKVAVFHSFYRTEWPSGENIAVQQQIDSLCRAGIEIMEFFRHTDRESQKPWYRIKTAAQIATGHDFYDPLPAIQEFAPDLIQIHNLTPNFGTNWLSKTHVPIVTTLHNFRTACANGLLYRDGRVCLECPTKGSKSAVLHGCYQDSRIASVPLAIANRGGSATSPIIEASQVVITQSSRVHEFMAQEGVLPQKLRLIPGFVEEVHSGVTDPPEQPRFVFVGRDTPEKGLSQLLEIWPNRYPIDVMGSAWPDSDGNPINDNVHFLGIQDRQTIRSQLPRYSALVFPGRVWEGAYPLVVREALEAGIPVISLEGSSAADLVSEASVGATYRDGSISELTQAIETVLSSGSEFRFAARTFFENNLTETAWSGKTIGVYADAVLRRNDS